MRTRAIATGLMLAAASAAAQEALVPYAVEGDAIPRPLGERPGDAARGLALMQDRHRSLCVLCHAGPFAPPHMQGTLAPPLVETGARLSPGQIRLRIVDMKALNPRSIMPSYHRVATAPRVAEARRGQPILSAEEIEDLVAYLATLRDDRCRGAHR